MFYIGETSVRMQCRIDPCNKPTNIRIGHPNRRGSWIFVCEDHLRQLGEEINEYFKNKEAALVAEPTIETDSDGLVAETVEPVDDNIAALQAETQRLVDEAAGTLSEKETVADENAEKSDETEKDSPNSDENPENEQEYYVCKDCGEKFKKPDELKEYKAHRMNAHRPAKA